MPYHAKWEDPTADLTAVVAVGAGTWVAMGAADVARFLIVAASVTTGGTVLVQGNTKADGTGTTVTVNTTSVTTNGTTRVEVTTTDIFPAMRTNLSIRTDGTYTTTVARHV